MRRVEIRNHILRNHTPAMRARNQAGSAVLFGEIIQHPDGIADPVSLLIGYRAAIGVQRLRPAVVGIGRANVEAAQFESRPQYVLHTLQNARSLDDSLEDLAFVDEVSEAAGVRLLLEF